MKAHLTTPLVVVVALAAGACGEEQRAEVGTVPAAQRNVTDGSTIVVRGDYGPDERGPFAFDGRYDVRFIQRGASVDFGAEVPFTAHLEQPAAGRAGRRLKLFEAATRAGSTTVSARGRFRVVVDFGDSPYELRFTRAGG
jgi:hypothetical protein